MSEKCGCKVIEYKNLEPFVSPTIQFCPLHSSAPQMREALEKAVSWLNTLVHIPMSYTQRNQINQRIEEAESALRSAMGEGVDSRTTEKRLRDWKE